MSDYDEEDPCIGIQGSRRDQRRGPGLAEAVTLGQADEPEPEPAGTLYQPVLRELAAHRRAFGAGIREGEHDHAEHEIPPAVRRYLVSGEEHASVFPLHPCAMGRTDLVLVGALAAAVTLHILLYAHGLAYPPVVKLIWCLFAIAAGYWAWQLTIIRSTWIVVTPKRIMTVVRFPVTKVTSLPWRRARDVELAQTVLGRMFGYGTLQLLSIGTDHALAQIQYVPNAERVYRVIWSILQPTRGKSPMPEEAW